MSLYRQLLLAIVASVALAFAGSFAATMLAARGYVQTQLAIKNADNAAALALSMSQLPKDPATLDLQVISLFETGQYQSIRVLDLQGRALAAHTAPAADAGAPAWFVRLLPINSQPGNGQIGDGFRQFGTVELTSVASFAYRDLWQGAQHMLLGFVAAATALGALAAAILARIRRPLARIVEQAQAISERRYLTLPPPAVPELRAVGEAMNQMVEQVRAMFAEEAARLESMRAAANLDELTRLPNRAYFMNRLRGLLDLESGAGAGVLLLFRLRDLGALNQGAGRAATDALILAAGESAADQAAALPHALAGRLNGADFALALPGADTPQAAAAALAAALDALPRGWRAPATQAAPLATLAATRYAPGEPVAALMARLDAALASAEQESGDGCPVALADAGDDALPRGGEQWREGLTRALARGWLRLDVFETRNFDGAPSHRECYVRLRLEEDGEWLPAARFLPQVVRLRMTAEFDLAVARETALLGGAGELALNLSADSLGAPGFGERLAAVIAAASGLAPRLRIDAPEKGIFQFPDGFHDLLARMKALGCRVGADHCGHDFGQLGRLYGIGLDYVKIDASFTRELTASPGNQTFLKGVCSISHNMGLKVYALGIDNAADLALLPTLGFDGATGPALSLSLKG